MDDAITGLEVVELTRGIVELIMTLDELPLGFTVTFTCIAVDRAWENCDRVTLTSRVRCTTTELIFSDTDGDNIRAELTLTEAVDETSTDGVDTKLGCTILVVNTT